MSRHDQLDFPIIARHSVESTTDELWLQIDLRLKLDELVEAEAEVLRAERRQQPSKKDLCRLACYIYDARRTRDRLIEGAIFGEPAWDIMLALYCLPARGEMLGTTALSYAANVPETTGLRWQRIMTDEGLIERGPAELPPRKQFVRLTDKGKSLMERYLIRLYECRTHFPPFPERAGG